MELARIPVDGSPLGVKVVKGVSLGFKVYLLRIACNFAAVLLRVWYLAPLEGGYGEGLSEGVELGGNMLFLWSRD